MEGNSDDDAFRQEFLSKMAGILGFAPPVILTTTPATTLLDEAHSMQAQIAHLKDLVDRYQAFVKEMSGESRDQGH